MFNELCPFVLRGHGYSCVSVPGQIDEVEVAVYSIEVDRLRTTRCIAGERQPAFSRKRIYQAGFADVASA